MKKAIIFDMYETLISLRSRPYMGIDICKNIGIDEAKFREIWNTTEDDRTLGNKTFEEVIEQILRVNDRYSEELYRNIIKKRIATNLYAFEDMHPDIVPMLQGLKNKDIKIGLITNCFFEERDAIRKSVLFQYFDVACMSCELGIMKPDQRIFDICIERLGVRAEDCLYCGDGGSHELEVAKSMNMLPIQALWYLREGSRQPVGRLDEFRGAESPMSILRIAE